MSVALSSERRWSAVCFGMHLYTETGLKGARRSLRLQIQELSHILCTQIILWVKKKINIGQKLHGLSWLFTFL